MYFTDLTLLNLVAFGNAESLQPCRAALPSCCFPEIPGSMRAELLHFPQHQPGTCLGFSCTIPIPAQSMDGCGAQDSCAQGTL